MARDLLTGLVHHLWHLVRSKAGRDPSPSLAIIDSQSVKTSHVGGPRSFDGSKLVKGRKRHTLTDTLGLLLAVIVHPARTHDSQAAPAVLERLVGLVPRLEKVIADAGYRGTPGGLVWRVFGWLWEVASCATRCRRASSW